ncbi:MAG: hypothetical protein JNL74_17905, partial [Fibrobacteres bacterium]|nr:hypothetical protein [Fibrobacterota bacterium]
MPVILASYIIKTLLLTKPLLESSLFIKRTNLGVYIKNLAKHPYFESWKDPVTGVESYILNKRVAPIQQSFYFTNSSLSQNEDLLWFYTAYPPSPGKTLGVVSLDPDNPFIHHFPNAEFTSASPMVAPEGDAVYFSTGGDIGFGTQGTSIWRMKIGEEPQRVCTLDVKFINRRTVTRLATHLTMSADKRYFLVDGAFIGHWFIGLADIQTGEIKILKEFKNHYNHAQFSPVDPNL